MTLGKNGAGLHANWVWPDGLSRHTEFIGGQRYSGLLEGKGTVDYWMAKVQLITGTTIIFRHTV